MGLFGGGNSSSTSVDNRADNSGNSGYQNIGDNGISAKIGAGAISLQETNDSNINITQTDQGAIEAGERIATLSLQSSERTFEDLADTLKDVTYEAFDTVGDNTARAFDSFETTQEQAFDLVEESQAQAFSFSQDTTDSAFDFSENLTERAFASIDQTNAQAISSNNSVLLSALESQEGILEMAILESSDRSSESTAIARDALDSASRSTSSLSSALQSFGNDLAKANRSSGQEIMDTVKPLALVALGAFTLISLMKA